VKQNFKMGLVISGILLMSVMLFAPNPLESYERLNQAFWNTGHLFLFAFLSGLILMQPPLRRCSWQVKLVFCLLLSVLLGGAIELAQYAVGRYMEFNDLLLDILGGLLGFLVVFFYVPQKTVLSVSEEACSAEGGGDGKAVGGGGANKNSANKDSVGKDSVDKERAGKGKAGGRALGAILILLVLVLAFYPVFMIVLDDYRMQRDFPVLAALESVNELPRWEGENVNRLELASTRLKKGRYSLLVEFSVRAYSSITLQSFPADWRGYRWLNISAYNNQADELPVELKVFDQRHTETGYRYADRFNRDLMLQPGWNDIAIDLSDIQNAPQGRKIDLQKMTVISLFVYRQSEPKVIYLDDIHLSK